MSTETANTEFAEIEAEIALLTQKLNDSKRKHIISCQERIDALNDKIYDLDQEHMAKIKHINDELDEIKENQLKLFKEVNPSIYRIRVNFSDSSYSSHYGYFSDSEQAHAAINSIYINQIDMKVVLVPVKDLKYDLITKLNESPSGEIWCDYDSS